MIDLHTHTTESDGTLTPAQLVQMAAAVELEALSITDHDTFSGYEAAVPYAQTAGVRLICGIEISTAWGKPKEQTVHLLGYWLKSPPTASFRAWLRKIQDARKDRNGRLAAKLQSLGVEVALQEAEALGRNMTGRPHFARVMVRKGFCSDVEDAFERFLDESAAAYVDRDEPSFPEAVERVLESGGIASLAHPVRLGRTGEDERDVIAEMVRMGLPAIEVWHSDHTALDVARYTGFARDFGLLCTGGSDFHGDIKPRVSLGRGTGNLNVPSSVLELLTNGRPRAAR